MAWANKQLEIREPGWLPGAIKQMTKMIETLANPACPDTLKAPLIAIACMRLLRCVFGSDLNTADAIRKKVLEDVEEQQKIDKMTPREQAIYFAKLKKEI